MTERMNFPEGKYRAILADPPWAYSVWSGKNAWDAARHYPVMTEQELCNLPVHRLAAKDCALFMWATSPLLPTALKVMDAWGFQYKTVAFVWAKTYRTTGRFMVGLGHWTRSCTELVLLGTRGKPKRRDKNVHQLVIADRMEHSRKPEEVHARIERLVDGPYVELFARRRKRGWACWGNEV